MRARTFGFAVAAVSVGFLTLTHPEVVGFTVMLLGAVAFWRVSRRWGVRR
ncbi:hypothetical protein IU459_04520 [Nocardia amamiensis]|uniref:Uncharacterized protein n=1 Tax=Nocardia amamiensis TaxID=404578 RepID=A0ABS0CLW7_9NOCA|nr:hypothetical protein [Nocardia amamiensis]MBF6296808.1 hypothetical protein [Nocardia amamiensis]